MCSLPGIDRWPALEGNAPRELAPKLTGRHALTQLAPKVVQVVTETQPHLRSATNFFSRLFS